MGQGGITNETRRLIESNMFCSDKYSEEDSIIFKRGCGALPEMLRSHSFPLYQNTSIITYCRLLLTTHFYGQHICLNPLGKSKTLQFFKKSAQQANLYWIPWRSYLLSIHAHLASYSPLVWLFLWQWVRPETLWPNSLFLIKGPACPSIFVRTQNWPSLNKEKKIEEGAGLKIQLYCCL